MATRVPTIRLEKAHKFFGEELRVHVEYLKNDEDSLLDELLKILMIGMRQINGSSDVERYDGPAAEADQRPA